MITASAAVRRALAAAGATMLSVVLLGCGGGAPAATTAATKSPTGTPAATQGGGGPAADVCSLVPNAAVTAALGEPVAAGQAGQKAGTGAAYCRYTATTSANYVEVQFQRGIDRSSWDADMARVGMTKGTAVESLGDAAWWELTSGGTRIAAFDDGLAIWVTIRKPDLDGALIRGLAEPLARALLESLRA